MPTALDWPSYDREMTPVPMAVGLPRGVAVYSLPSERTVYPAEIWSTGAAEQRDIFWQRVLRDRCAMREVLQIANGEAPEPDPICLSVPAP